MLAKNQVFHAKTKHIEVKYHFIREMLEDKLMKLVNVHNNDNLVALLTKGLPPKWFAHLWAFNRYNTLIMVVCTYIYRYFLSI